MDSHSKKSRKSKKPKGKGSKEVSKSEDEPISQLGTKSEESEFPPTDLVDSRKHQTEVEEADDEMLLGDSAESEPENGPFDETLPSSENPDFREGPSELEMKGNDGETPLKSDFEHRDGQQPDSKSVVSL